MPKPTTHTTLRIRTAMAGRESRREHGSTLTPCYPPGSLIIAWGGNVGPGGGRLRLARSVGLIVVLAITSLGSPLIRPALAAVSLGPLVAPVLVSPAPYAASSGILMQWRAVGGAVRYEVELRSVPATTLSVCGGETESLQMTCDWVPPGVYTWTVRAIGPEQRRGPAAVARPFTKTPALLGAPSILFPATGTTFDYPDGLGVLRWTPVPNAAYYQVDIAQQSTFPDSPVDGSSASITTTGVAVPVEILGSTRYWRVRAVSRSKKDVGPWSAARSFRVRWTNAPILDSPANGSTVSDPVLAWLPMAGASRYELQTAAIADPAFDAPTAQADTSQTSIDWGAPSGTSFLWRVRGVDWAGGRSPWSASRSLTVDAGANPAATPTNALVAPQLIGPADGASNVDPIATPLSWHPVPGTVGYDLQVIPMDMAWPSIDGSPPNHLPFIATPLLEFGTTYKWRVRANASDGLFVAGPWSSERSFSTPALGTVTLGAPAAGATVSYEDLVFTWAGLPYAAIDYVELSASPGFESPTVLEPSGLPRIELRASVAPGTWFWRVKAGHGNTTAISPARSVEIVDDVPPAGTVMPDNWSTVADTITVGAQAEDAASEPDRYAVSADGSVWDEFPYLEQQTWSLVSPEHGGPDPGPRQLWTKWRDTAGNWSTPRVNHFYYGPVPDDVSPPVVTAPRVIGITPAASVPATGTIPIRISWSGFDALSGLRAFELLRRTDRVGGWQTVVSDYIGPTSLDRLVAPAHLYEYMVRATDTALNTSSFATSSAYSVARYPETAAQVVYRGSWTLVSSTAYLGGKARRSGSAGSTATFTFTGRSVALISLPGPSRGAATIYVNGVRAATIDLYSRTYLKRQIVWSRDWLGVGTRTVTIRVAGTLGRPVVDIDGFAIVR
jgi:hypothetical protein